MNISSQSLFHYAPSLDVIKLILQNGIRFSQLSEELPLSGYSNNIFDQIPGLIKHVNFHEGVCLCDIPLSAAQNHRQEYGKYAIGFSKEWGFNVGASPVRYVHQSSPDIGSEAFSTFLDLPAEIQRRGTIYETFAEFLEADSFSFDKLSNDQQKVLKYVDQFCCDLLEFVGFYASFLRIYEGEWEDRSSNNTTHRVFYDEREWRIVRHREHGDFVKFTAADLRHIIVENDDERDEIIDHVIKNCHGLKMENKESFSRKVKTFSETFDEA